MDKNKLWTIIGVVFAALSFVVGALALIPLTKSKSLSYEIRSETNFAPISDFGNFDFNFDGHKLVSPQLTVIRMSNDGNIPIGAADFDGPLRIAFPDGKVEAVRVAVTNPDGIPLRVSKVAGEVHVEPILLNPGDTFGLSILISENDAIQIGPEKLFKGRGDLKVIARISDLLAVVNKSTAKQVGSIRYPMLLVICLSIPYFLGVEIFVLSFRRRSISTRRITPEAIVLALSALGAMYSIGQIPLQLAVYGKMAMLMGFVVAGIAISYRAIFILGSRNDEKLSSPTIK